MKKIALFLALCPFYKTIKILLKFSRCRGIIS